MKTREWQDLESIEELKAGDLIRHKMPVERPFGETLMVQANYGDRATAIRTADVTNAPEWEVFR